MPAVIDRVLALEEYIASQFADGRIPEATDPRDFYVVLDDETITVDLMRDDEPERTWSFTFGSDDDCYIFINPDDERDYFRIDLMPEN